PVLKTISPTAWPCAPYARPWNVRPSSSTSTAASSLTPIPLTARLPSHPHRHHARREVNSDGLARSESRRISLLGGGQGSRGGASAVLGVGGGSGDGGGVEDGGVAAEERGHHSAGQLATCVRGARAHCG